MLDSMRTKPYYKFLIWGLAVSLFIFILWLGMGLVTNPKWFMGDDFVEYWAAGKLNLSGSNPYDPVLLQPLELQTGVIEGDAVLMWNPPWMLALAMPLGALGYPLSRILWLVLNILVIFLCLNTMWSLYDGKNDYRWVAWVIGFTFVPILDGLKKGQTSALLLLGVVGFLFFMSRRKYWFAGFCLSLLAVKPHILYLIIAAAFFWSINQKKWQVIFGFFIPLVIATTLSWIINPDVMQQYIYAIQNYPPADWVTPTIGSLLRLLLGTDRFWLQFVPSLLGLFWLIYYWIRNRREWNWVKQAPLLILVSTLTAAYGWSWDLTVSIVAILHVAVLIIPLRRDLRTIWIIITYLMIDVLIFLIPGNQLFTFWLAPALLIWYLASNVSIQSYDKERLSSTL